MNNNRQKHNPPAQEHSSAQPPAQVQFDAPDDRYPGTFFRIPGIPQPGKTTWSLVK